MNEEFRENPEGKNENFVVVGKAIERQKSILEQIDTEQKKSNPDKENLKTLMAQMEVANKEAQEAWDTVKNSMESNRKQEVAGEEK
ncbi:MAG: hypothetical protein HQ538_05230 [Parcubacteria group bacterium]|nr:hypothetical protein [Parcubacteria group bacterium]